MLGSASEAEDAVQETWIRLSRTDVDDVASLRRWLTTVVARVCLDMLRARTSRREDPLDVRLPDPIITRGAWEPETEAMLADSVASRTHRAGHARTGRAARLRAPRRLRHDVEIAPIVDRSPGAGFLDRAVSLWRIKADKSSGREASIKKPKKVPVLLSGGNPQIAKADGDAPVQAYIAAMPGWKRDVGRRLDALIVRTVPGVRKAVKWNSPFYGSRGPGLVPRLPLLHELRQGGFLPRHVAASCPARRVQAQGSALPRHPRGRPARRGADGDVDPAGGRPARLGPVAKHHAVRSLLVRAIL